MTKTGSQLISEVFKPLLEDVLPFQSSNVTAHLEKYLLEIWPDANYVDNIKFRTSSNQGTKLVLTYKKNSTFGPAETDPTASYLANTDIEARLIDANRASLFIDVFDSRSVNGYGGEAHGPRVGKGFIQWNDFGENPGKSDDTSIWMRSGFNNLLSPSSTKDGWWIFTGTSHFTLHASLGAKKRYMYLDGFDSYTQEGSSNKSEPETALATFEKFEYRDFSKENSFSISFSGTKFQDAANLRTEINWVGINIESNGTRVYTRSLEVTVNSLFSGLGVSLSNLLEDNDGTQSLINSVLPIVMSGDNELMGSRNDDQLYGYAGNDRLRGGVGNDTLLGGSGNDLIYGGAGNDWMEHVNDPFDSSYALGQDTYYGERGNDVYVIDELGATIVERRNEGIDSVYTQLDNFKLADHIENLIHDRDLNAINFTGRGNSLGNLIRSSSGNDSLFGSGGNDTLLGDAGNDYLSGGTGRDTFTGGKGADKFVFDTAPNSRTNADTILDFNSSDGDQLVIDDAFFAKFTISVTAGNLRINTTGRAQDTDDYMILNSTNGKLFYDADGSGRVIAVEIATLTGVSTLSHLDFFII